MLPVIGLIPLALVGYGLYSKRRGFVWFGAIWIAWSVLYWFSTRNKKR